MRFLSPGQRATFRADPEDPRPSRIFWKVAEAQESSDFSEGFRGRELVGGLAGRCLGKPGPTFAFPYRGGRFGTLAFIGGGGGRPAGDPGENPEIFSAILKISEISKFSRKSENPRNSGKFSRILENPQFLGFSGIFEDFSIFENFSDFSRIS